MDHAFRQDPSVTGVLKALKDLDPLPENGHPLHAVVIGGGTGAPVSIRTLLSMGVVTDAVVAMADDGGSTGILRKEIDATPPGDIRKCLAAFAKDPEAPLTRIFKYRLEFAQNHTLGNLILSALEDATDSFPEAIAICEGLLEAQGHVYPSTLDRVVLGATTRKGNYLEGQANACNSAETLARVELREPQVCTPYGPALKAIRAADLIVLGPGSLFTSIIPNLLVPGVIDAIRESQGKIIFVCSLADMQGETRGMSAAEHVEALLDHGMEGLLNYVLLHSTDTLRDLQNKAYEEGQTSLEQKHFAEGPQGEVVIYPVPVTLDDIQTIQARGSIVLLRNLVDPQRPTWHGAEALREAFAGVIEQCRLPQM